MVNFSLNIIVNNTQLNLYRIPCGLRTPRPISGPFGLDMDFMGRIDAKKPLLATPKLITFDDLDELLGEVPDLNQIKMQAKTSHK